MVAAAYKVDAIFEGLRSKRRIPIRFSATDVADAYWTQPSGSSDLILPVGENWRIVDFSYTSAGTDTTNVVVYKNGTLTPLTVSNTANLYSAASGRQMQQAMINLEGGSLYRFQQKA